MTATYIGGGELTLEELLAPIELGVYIHDFNHGSGMSTFTIAPNKAYMIRNGKLAEPVRISVVTGSVMHTLHEIDGLTKDVKVCSLSTGGAAKGSSGPLRVAFGRTLRPGPEHSGSVKEERIMVKELYQTILRETSLNVTSGEIDSIRKKSITKSGCRVYDGSYLGVSGVLGEPTPEAWTQAEANCPAGFPAPGARRRANAGPVAGARPWMPVDSSSWRRSC